MVLRISSWMSVRPSVSRRRPMLVLSFRCDAARSGRALEDYPAVSPGTPRSTMTNLTSVGAHEATGPREPRHQGLSQAGDGLRALGVQLAAELVALRAD